MVSYHLDPPGTPYGYALGVADIRVTDAYSARAEEYAAVFGTIDSLHPQDCAFVLRWAGSVVGPIVDAGCGPGQWTALLVDAGIDVVGVDPTAPFVEMARRRFPHAAFRQGTFDDLGVSDGSLGGVLAWYSLIHLDPSELDLALSAIERALSPVGSVLIGFFDGPAGEPFDHAVTTAWWWSVPELTRRLHSLGLAVTETQARRATEHRPLGALIARRRTVGHSPMRRPAPC